MRAPCLFFSVFLKRIIRSQIETIRQLREDHHYIPVIMESPEAAVADPQLRLCHLAFSMAEKEKAPESSPDTFRFSKPRRRRSGMSENDHSSVGRQRSQRLSDIPRSPRVQLEGDDPSASRPLNKSSRRESRRSVPAPAAKEVERQAVPAAILTLAASAPRTARRVSNFESLSDKRDKTPEADKILPPEQPVQEGAIKPRHVVKEIKPLVEKQPVQSVEAPTPADQLISEHQEAEKESEEPGAKVSVAKHSPVNEEGTINVRRATKAEVGNSDDRTIEKIVVEEPSANAAADPPDAVVIEDGPVQDGVIIHHSEERHPSESKPDRYSLAEETPAAGKVLARERSVKTSILKERPVVNGVAEEWMAMGKARRSRRQSTTDGHSERRSVEKGLPEERRSGVDRTLAQEETSSRRSTAETLAKEQPAQAKLTDRTSSIRVEVPKGRPVEMGHARSCLVQQPRAEDQSTDAGAVEDLPVRRGSSETRGRPAEEIATSEKPVRYGPAILGEESVGGMREDRRSFHDQPAKVERTRRRSSDKRLAEEMQSSPEQLAQERLVQGHLGNQSSLRMMRRNGVKHGDTVRGYINIGSLHHQEAVAHVDRGIRKNLISRAFANELQLEIQGNPGVLFYGDEKMSSDGAVTFNWGDEEITCHVINKLESPLVFGRDFLAERKGGG